MNASFSHLVSENFMNVIAVAQRLTAVTTPENVCELEKQIDVSKHSLHGILLYV